MVDQLGQFEFKLYVFYVWFLLITRVILLGILSFSCWIVFVVVLVRVCLRGLVGEAHLVVRQYLLIAVR